MTKNLSIKLAFIFLLHAVWSFAEGTKQIMPTSGSSGELQVMENFSQFARFGSPEDQRLNIKIKTVGEKICYGFGDRRENNGTILTDVEYQIKDPNGNVVVGPAVLPTSGGGYISTWDQANIGPTTLAGNTGGYTPLTYTPTMTGDYYIEFNYTGNDRCRFKYFDITVGSSTNQEIDGRVWSKGWQFTAINSTGEFTGSMYIYADDGIVTKINFNGIKPYVFTVYCNINGVTNTGVWAVDRMSNENPDIPVNKQYKIFLNDPDITQYPTGAFGIITGPVTTFCPCDGLLQINVPVNKAGLVDIFFNINPLPGTQAEDLSMTADVVVGNNTLTWNGLNGLGAQVASGTQFNLTVTYINGLTNLPMRDPDTNPYGFIVDLIRPTGPKPALFWDDSDVGGTVNLTGCTVTSGCHSFSNWVGNDNMINTWWYASSTTGDPVNVEYRKSYSGTTNQSICTGDSILFTGIWRHDAGLYYDSLFNQQGCDSVNIVNLSLKPVPTVNLGPDTTTCNGEPVTFSAPAGTGYTYLWSNGVTNQNITVNTNGTYSCTVTNPQGCPKTDSVNYITYPIPTAIPIKHD
jgi:hypothetical protein